MTDFPAGDGLPDCPQCFGRGAIDYKPEGAIVPGVLTCECVLERDIRLNMERGWRGLSTIEPVEESPLEPWVEDTHLWVRASNSVLRRHLARVAFAQGANWRFQVSSDADLMDAWLSHISTDDLFDADIGLRRHQQVSNRYPALVDLVEPPQLLVLCVSVKAARNAAMPEVLLEALQHRDHLARPTWIVDTPVRALGAGHIAWDDSVGEFLAEWPFIDLMDGTTEVAPGAPSTVGGMPDAEHWQPPTVSEMLGGDK